MRIIFFNVNDATIDSPGIKKFLLDNKENTDMFCFQEFFKNMPDICKETLKEFDKTTIYKYVSEPDYFSQGTAIKQHIIFTDIKILLEDCPTLGIGLYTQITINGQILNVVNFHGISRPVEKLDCPERIEQSKKVIDFIKTLKEPVVVGGDFNILLDQQSISMFEAEGYKNLIKDFRITNTRNEVVWRKYPNSKMYYSDYVFVSPQLQIKNFQVPYNEISDHLPMILDLDL